MAGLALLFFTWMALAAAQSSSILSEGDPFQPVPSYSGLIVEGGHISAQDYGDGSDFVAAIGRLAKADALITAGKDNLQETLTNCSRSCALASGCSAFFYCTPGGGRCSGAPSGDLPELACELVVQAESNPNRTQPFMAMVGQNSQFIISGSPILSQQVQEALPLSGFLQLRAQSFYNKYDYACAGTLVPGSCALRGSPAELAATCRDNSQGQCHLMVWYPQGRPDIGVNITFLKGGNNILVDPSLANLNQHAVSYVEIGAVMTQAVDSGGLKAGSVAGIAIGSAALAVAAVLLVGTIRKRRRESKSSHDRKNEPGLPVIIQLQRPSLPRGISESTRPTGDSLAASIPSQTTPASTGDSGTSGRGALVSAPPAIVFPRGPISPFVTVRPSIDMDTPFQFPESVEGGTSSSQQVDLVGIPVMSAEWDRNADFPPRESTGRTVKSLDVGQRLQSAASTAGVLEAIKDADWKHYSVDLDSIKWVRHSNGTLWELGHGAFSKVFKVILHDTIELAAKIIPLEDAKAEKVFLRETITLFHLRHANIVQFSGVCIHQRQGILLMELMEGGSLFGCMGLKGSDHGRVVGWYHEGKRIAVGIAQALHHLHTLNLVHMDLKSANVLLTRDFSPKLADVGFTRVWQSMEMSQKDSRIGTFAYMAPELLLGGSIKSAADIYSFGVLLREICTGEYPSRGRNRLPIVPQDCPQEVLDLILACLQNDPDNRPTAKDLYSILVKCPQ